MKAIIAIDPGAGGGIAVQYGESPSEVQACKMPGTLKDIWDCLATAIKGANLQPVVYMEKVGTYMPGNSGPSAATFAEHVGALKMALIGQAVRHVLVTPQKWQAAFIGKPNYPKIPATVDTKQRKAILAKRKQERKNAIKAKAQQLYPHIKVTLAVSDALGILHYAVAIERNPVKE